MFQHSKRQRTEFGNHTLGVPESCIGRQVFAPLCGISPLHDPDGPWSASSDTDHEQSCQETDAGALENVQT